MTKRQKRLLVITLILIILLALLGGYFYIYKKTKRLSFNLTASTQGTIAPPQFLFSFSGTGVNRLQRPIGVLVDGGRVYVADSVRGVILTFDENGKMLGSFGASQTVDPLYLAKNPKDGNIYVTDRRKYTIFKYTPDGKYVGQFIPKLPKNELPQYKTIGGIWQPLAIGFAPDGTMYVTEILKGHRLLVFGPDGTFKKSIGFAGIVTDPKLSPDAFQFPNGIMVTNNELYVSDSNNQRVKVYDLAGNFKRLIVTAGLPRGIVSLGAFPGEGPKAPGRFVEVDTLAHDATIWTVAGVKVLSFGEQGVLDGQFSYPNGIGLGTKNKLYIADTANGRVQVWGWPAQIASLPPIAPKNLWWCLTPLLLLPLLLLLRKREFFATADFVETMIAAEQADLLPDRRRRWRTTQAEYEKIKLLHTETTDMGELFAPNEFSESDVKALMDKYELDRETAITLSTASRAYVTCTQSDELRRMAKIMEIDVVNAAEFMNRFHKKQSAQV